MLLSDYKFTIHHRPGRLHGHVDALSRAYGDKAEWKPDPADDATKDATEETEIRVHAVEDMSAIPVWDRQLIKQMQENDDFYKPAIEKLKRTEGKQDKDYFLDNDGVLFKIGNDGLPRLAIPSEFVEKALHDFHNLPLSGHPGQDKTLTHLKSRLFWPSMKTDVTRYCHECRSCNERKTSPHLTRARMQKFESLSRPFERTAMDIVGPLVTSYEGNKYLLTFQDHFTKYPEAIPLPDQTAATVAKALVTHVICRHGCPDVILSDKGSNFLSQMMREVCRFLQIDRINTTAYRPQANGVIERSHRTFKDVLSHYIEKSQRDWDQWVPFMLAAFRSHIHSATGYSPFFLIHGRDMVLPFDNILRPQRKRYDLDENYAAEMMQRLNQAFETTRANLERTADRTEKIYNRKSQDREYQLGDLVYLHDPSLKTGLSKKLQRPWTGPYRIIEKKGPVTYKIREVGSKKEDVVHTNRLKKYFEKQSVNKASKRVIDPEEDSTDSESDLRDSWRIPKRTLRATRDAVLKLLPLFRSAYYRYSGTTPKEEEQPEVPDEDNPDFTTPTRREFQEWRGSPIVISSTSDSDDSGEESGSRTRRLRYSTPMSSHPSPDRDTKDSDSEESTPSGSAWQPPTARPALPRYGAKRRRSDSPNSPLAPRRKKPPDRFSFRRFGHFLRHRGAAESDDESE